MAEFIATITTLVRPFPDDALGAIAKTIAVHGFTPQAAALAVLLAYIQLHNQRQVHRMLNFVNTKDASAHIDIELLTHADTAKALHLWLGKPETTEPSENAHTMLVRSALEIGALRIAGTMLALREFAPHISLEFYRTVLATLDKSIDSSTKALVSRDLAPVFLSEFDEYAFSKGLAGGSLPLVQRAFDYLEAQQKRCELHDKFGTDGVPSAGVEEQEVAQDKLNEKRDVALARYSMLRESENMLTDTLVKLAATTHDLLTIGASATDSTVVEFDPDADYDDKLDFNFEQALIQLKAFNEHADNAKEQRSKVNGKVSMHEQFKVHTEALQALFQCSLVTRTLVDDALGAIPPALDVDRPQEEDAEAAAAARYASLSVLND